MLGELFAVAGRANFAARPSAWIALEGEQAPAVVPELHQAAARFDAGELEGVPCSVPGLVTPDGVAVFRPVERLLLRHAGSGRLRDAGVATFWDPEPTAGEQMRDVARRVARVLVERAHFGGAFGVHGVVTADGFLPTGLETRIGAGFDLLDRAAVGLPLALVALCAQSGRTLDYRPTELEHVVVEQADARRGADARVAVDAPDATPREIALAADGDGYRRQRGDEPVAARLVLEPSEAGSSLVFAPAPDRTPAGPALAPRACRAFALAERELGIALGDLEPAAAPRAR